MKNKTKKNLKNRRRQRGGNDCDNIEIKNIIEFFEKIDKENLYGSNDKIYNDLFILINNLLNSNKEIIINGIDCIYKTEFEKIKNIHDQKPITAVTTIDPFDLHHRYLNFQ